MPLSKSPQNVNRIPEDQGLSDIQKRSGPNPDGFLVFETGSLRATLNQPSRAATICFPSQAASSASYLPGLFRGISSGTGKKANSGSFCPAQEPMLSSYNGDTCSPWYPWVDRLERGRREDSILRSIWRRLQYPMWTLGGREPLCSTDQVCLAH